MLTLADWGREPVVLILYLGDEDKGIIADESDWSVVSLVATGLLVNHEMISIHKVC